MKKNTYILLLACLFIGNVSAQESWSLQKCVSYAQDNSITLKQASLSVKNTVLSLKQAKYSPYPTLNGRASYNLNFGRSIDPLTNTYETQTLQSNGFSLNSDILIYGFGRIKNSIKQSESDLNASKADMRQTAENLGLNIAQIYLSILLAEEQLEISKERITLSAKQLTQTDKLIAAGTLARNNRLDIIARIAQEEQSVIAAENSVDLHYLLLKQALQLPTNEKIKIEQPKVLIPDTNLNDLSVEKIYSEALNTQAAVEAGEHRRESAQLGTKIARSNLLPSLYGFANASTNYSNLGKRVNHFEPEFATQEVLIDGQASSITSQRLNAILENNPYFNQLNDNLGGGAGVSLSIPIFNGYKNEINVERAQLNVVNTEYQNQLIKQQLKSDIQNALANARASDRKLSAAKKTVIALHAAFKNTEKRFSLGASTTLEFNTAKNALDVAQSDLIVSKYQYLFNLKVLEYYQGKKISL